MSWNQPNTHTAKGGKSAKRSHSSLCGLIAVLILVAGGVLCCYFFAAKPEATKPEIVKPIVKPSVTKRAARPRKPVVRKAEPEQVRQYHELSNEEKLKRITDKYGDKIPENLKSTVYFLKHPPQVTYTPARSRASIFNHPSERSIASILLIEPGASLLRKPVYDEFFDRNFLKSLENPTPILDTDSPEERELKESVSQVKNEIAERMKAGEKPSDILNQAIDTAYELGKYKHNLEDIFSEAMRNPAYSDADLKDMVEAANTMLKAKGAKEMSMPSLVLRQVRLKAAARKAAQRDAQMKGTEQK